MLVAISIVKIVSVVPWIYGGNGKLKVCGTVSLPIHCRLKKCEASKTV